MLLPLATILAVGLVNAAPAQDSTATTAQLQTVGVSCQSYDPYDGHVYQFQNNAGWTYLDLEDGSYYDGTKVQGYTQADPGYINNQLWRATRVGKIGNDCLWTLQNVASGSYLTVPYGDQASGTRVQGWNSDPNHDEEQWWSFTAVINGHQTLKNHKSGTCLSLYEGSSDLRTPIQGAWCANYATEQNWLVYDKTYLVD